ncbi:related to acetylxylan esterase precursor [Rhynchosporium graminicola]|uniref:Related to acetylxylan esterase n=1 Tax=Rhynchosporium graminicola TaxID=2792576 RepID=A0A1E1L0Z0_9HELO|nr:related to acetylxylan esterase precursor [Rhynchosporium commune]
MKISSALIVLASVVSAAPVVEERQAACASGVHMIIARASGEAVGPGFINAVATRVKSAVPGSDSEAVSYPATLDNYQSSQSQGVAAMKKLITSYVTRCPNTKIALLGYSQGAHVAADVMCGSLSGFAASTQISSAIASKNIIAVIEMGDPSHIVGQVYDVGTSKKNGIFLRTNAATCLGKTYTQNYCDTGDTYCDQGNIASVHSSYVSKYGSAAAAYIAAKFKAAA